MKGRGGGNVVVGGGAVVGRRGVADHNISADERSTQNIRSPATETTGAAVADEVVTEGVGVGRGGGGGKGCIILLDDNIWQSV